MEMPGLFRQDRYAVLPETEARFSLGRLQGVEDTALDYGPKMGFDLPMRKPAWHAAEAIIHTVSENTTTGAQKL